MSSNVFKTTKTNFKEGYSFEKRKEEADRMISKYPDRRPIIVEKANNCTLASDIDKKKYLVPADLTFGQLIYVVRKRIHLAPDQAIFLFCNNTMPPAAALVAQVYKDHKDLDGFLYVVFSNESTFGDEVIS